jgi:NADH-quinone oxidoreductase subunit N
MINNYIALQNLLPEMFLTFSILIFLLFKIDKLPHMNSTCAFGSASEDLRKHNIYFFVCFVILCITLILLMSTNYESSFENSLLINTQSTCLLKKIIIVISLFILGFIAEGIKLQKLEAKGFYIMFLFSVLSSLLILSINDFMSAFLLIEMQALTFYVLAAFKKSSAVTIEGALKYFIFSAVNSAFLFYSVSILYGTLGTLNFEHLYLITAFDLKNENTTFVCNLCCLIIFITLFFKIGVVPFHFWIPDIYESSPISSAIIFAILPKLIFLDLTIKIVRTFGIFTGLSTFIYFCGFSSILIGSIFALYQKRLKRFLIYSSIAQIGFPICLLGNGFSIESFSIIYLFVLIYLLNSILLWGLYILIYKSLNQENLDANENTQQFKDPVAITDLSGFFSIDKVWIFLFIIIFFGLAGIPPLAAFLSKFFIITILIRYKKYFLSVFILFVTVLATYYYLTFLSLIFFEIIKENIKDKKVFSLINIKDYIFFYNCFVIVICIFFLLHVFFFLDYWILLCESLAINLHGTMLK